MITIILKHHNKHTEVDMPAMYEELQLALWKLGLDREPEKYTLLYLGATFRYQAPLEYFVLRLLEGEMTLLDAVSAIYSVTAPPRPIMAQVQILSSGFKSITELRQEVERLILSTAQFGSSCYFPIRGWLVGPDGEMEQASNTMLFQHADVIGEAVQRMQSWIIHDMALCFADTETAAEESLFQKILSARWSVDKKGKKLYGRIDVLIIEQCDEYNKLQMIFGCRYEETKIPESFVNACGQYKIVNENLQDKKGSCRLSIKDNTLVLKVKLIGTKGSACLRAVSDNLAFVDGYGRGTGNDVVLREDAGGLYLSWCGLVFRKVMK